VMMHRRWAMGRCHCIDRRDTSRTSRGLVLIIPIGRPLSSGLSSRSNSLRERLSMRAGDLDHASGSGANGETEAVQLYNCRYQVQAKTQAR
jgi:hypothetical protein